MDRYEERGTADTLMAKLNMIKGALEHGEKVLASINEKFTGPTSPQQADVTKERLSESIFDRTEEVVRASNRLVANLETFYSRI